MRKSYTFIHWAGRTLLLVMMVFSLVACSRKVVFNSSTVVPGAEGYVKLRKDKNGNHAINLEIKNLAEAKKLAMPQNVYVVWAESPDGVKNLGQLRTGSGIFSSTLKADLETVTPYKPTRIFITAESSAGLQYPGAQVVLSTDSF